MATSALAARVETVRRFNRFYTRRIGVLGETLLDSAFSLTEARVLYELANRDASTASALCADLGLDPGYLSRILSRFVRAGLIRKSRSKEDARQSLIAITAKGRKAYAPLNAQSERDVAALLQSLPPLQQRQVVDAMRAVERLLDAGAASATEPIVLEPPRPGDFGWVVARHGALYAQEYGWTIDFEGLVVKIVADFVASFDPSRERCWIARRDGENVGCMFLVRGDGASAKLRLLLVEPSARGCGVGARLVGECIAFARACGYAKVTLWTQQNLTAARGIYRAAGFSLTKSEPHRSFGQDLAGETWELAL
jgi:DNA-binding MarR family transcriptional regulator/GNAT superfamily N-acetyltransferase